ncbi:MAG: hypothetical protein ABEI52_01670, partial [Halobacteriaceae archaeon]
RLRVAWSVPPDEMTVETTIDGVDETFRGGKGMRYWHLVCPHDANGVVLAVRSASEKGARQLATMDWEP